MGYAPRTENQSNFLWKVIRRTTNAASILILNHFISPTNKALSLGTDLGEHVFFMNVRWNLFIIILQQEPRINTNSEVFLLNPCWSAGRHALFHSSFPNTTRLSRNNQRQNHRWGKNQQKKEFVIRMIFATTSRMIQF